MSTSSEVVAGVDGARLGKQSGWVVVSLRGGRFEDASFHARFAEVVERYAQASVLGVDIPIGLGPELGRGADRAARAFLGTRSSTIFSPPPRSVLRAGSYAEACELCQAASGKKLSKQAWHLVPRIREVHAHLADERIVEVHPETSFQVLAGAPLALGKKTWGGQMERRRLLAQAGIVLPDGLPLAAGVAADDVLDAAVAAWSARRKARGESRCFPPDPTEHDGRRRIAIWA